MSSSIRRRRILEVVRDDATFVRVEGDGVAWRGRCIHCGAHLLVSPGGDLVPPATLEHIVPRAHGGTDEPGNLAIACARCNREKGKRHDPRGPGDPGYEKVVAYLMAQKEKRRRPPDGADGRGGGETGGTGMARGGGRPG